MERTRCKIGVIGAGDISDTYLKNFGEFDNLEVVALASRGLEKAQTQARKYNVAEVCTVEELLSKPEIGLVVNLTPPKSHFELAMLALKAGKSVYNEKPLGLTRNEGRQLVELAEERGVLLGCAPDTFLGAGLQTARKLLDEGLLGRVLGANGIVFHFGPEIWHPNPSFYYQEGAGPLLDIGPYYVNALVTLFGPVKRVTGSTIRNYNEKIATGFDTAGMKIEVSVPTYVSAILDFEAGPVANLITTFDIWPGNPPQFEIFGSDNMLSLSRPSAFGGPVRIKPTIAKGYKELEQIKETGHPEWQDLDLILNRFAGNVRGIGVADMAATLGYPADFQSASQPRANGEIAYHVLDIMESIVEASNTNRHIELTSTCKRPEPMF